MSQSAGVKRFLMLAEDFHTLTDALEIMGESRVGVLIESKAKQFHRAVKILKNLDHWMQRVVSELPQ